MTACSDTPAQTEPVTEVQEPVTEVQEPVARLEDEKPLGPSDQIRSDVISLAGVTLKVHTKGIMEPGAQYQMSFGLVDSEPGAIIRLWIGNESREGSLVFKAHSHGDHYHGAAEVPDEVNEQTALWLEVQSVSGEKETGSIPLQ